MVSPLDGVNRIGPPPPPTLVAPLLSVSLNGLIDQFIIELHYSNTNESAWDL